MSKKACGFFHGNDGSGETPIAVKAAAMIGDDALVPPTTCQPPQYTATPVCGSPTAETSDSTRILHPVSFCHAGFEMTPLHPLPPLLQADSAQPRDDADCCSDVPPTASTPALVAG